MRNAVCVAVAMFATAACVASRGFAAPVDLQSATQLNADVTADVTVGAASASKNDHHTGSLDNGDVTASASAKIPIATDFFTGTGDSAAHLITDADGFTLSSRANTTLSGTVQDSGGEVRST